MVEVQQSTEEIPLSPKQELEMPSRHDQLPQPVEELPPPSDQHRVSRPKEEILPMLNQHDQILQHPALQFSLSARL
jgi:hypothetical protein